MAIPGPLSPPDEFNVGRTRDLGGYAFSEFCSPAFSLSLERAASRTSACMTVGKLGQGSIGQVDEVQCTETGLFFAIKTIELDSSDPARNVLQVGCQRICLYPWGRPATWHPHPACVDPPLRPGGQPHHTARSQQLWPGLCTKPALITNMTWQEHESLPASLPSSRPLPSAPKTPGLKSCPSNHLRKIIVVILTGAITPPATN